MRQRKNENCRGQTGRAWETLRRITPKERNCFMNKERNNSIERNNSMFKNNLKTAENQEKNTKVATLNEWHSVFVPVSLCQDNELNGTDRDVWIFLKRRICNQRNNPLYGFAFPHEQTIADEIGKSRWTVMRSLKNLEKTGWIEKHKRYGAGRPNAYKVFDQKQKVDNSNNINGKSQIICSKNATYSGNEKSKICNIACSKNATSHVAKVQHPFKDIKETKKKERAVCDTDVVEIKTHDTESIKTTHTNEFINISFEELKDILYHERLIELAMSVWEKHYLQWDSKKQFIQTLKSFTSQTDNPETILNALNDYSIGKNKPPEHLLAAFRRLNTEIQTNSRDKKFVDNFDTKCNELWGKPTWKIKEELEVEKQEKALLSEFHKNLTGLKDEDKEAFFNDFIDQGWSYVKEDPVYLEIKNASDEYYSLKEILYGIERRYEVFQKVLSGNMDDVYFYTHWLNNPLETDDIQDERMTEMKSWIEGYEQRIKREQEEQEERKKREIEEKQRKENEIKESIIKEILHEYDRMKAGEMAEDYLYQNIDIPKDLFTDERIKPVIRWHDSFRQKVLDQQIKQIMESKRVNH